MQRRGRRRFDELRQPSFADIGRHGLGNRYRKVVLPHLPRPIEQASEGTFAYREISVVIEPFADAEGKLVFLQCVPGFLAQEAQKVALGTLGKLAETEDGGSSLLVIKKRTASAPVQRADRCDLRYRTAGFDLFPDVAHYGFGNEVGRVQ